MTLLGKLFANSGAILAHPETLLANYVTISANTGIFLTDPETLLEHLSSTLLPYQAIFLAQN